MTPEEAIDAITKGFNAAVGVVQQQIACEPKPEPRNFVAWNGQPSKEVLRSRPNNTYVWLGADLDGDATMYMQTYGTEPVRVAWVCEDGTLNLYTVTRLDHERLGTCLTNGRIAVLP